MISRYRMKTVLLISHQITQWFQTLQSEPSLHKEEVKRAERFCLKNGENIVIIPKCPQVCHQENRITLVPYSLYPVLLLMAELESVSESCLTVERAAPQKNKLPRGVKNGARGQPAGEGTHVQCWVMAGMSGRQGQTSPRHI